MKNLLNRKLFELFDKKVRNYSLFDKFLNPYLNPSLVLTYDVLGFEFLVGVESVHRGILALDANRL
jgi:hypothetical protein